MEKRITTRLISLLTFVTTALARVKIQGHLEDGAVLENDDMMFDLSTLFDLSGADRDTLSFKATQATGQGTGTEIRDSIYDYETNLNNLQYDANQLTLIKYLDERSFILFYDENTYLYQELSPNSTIRVTHWKKTFTVFTSATVSCQDAVLSPNKDEILVGCTTKSSTSSKSIWLFRVSRKDGEIIQTLHKDLAEDDISFTNRMQIGLYNLPQVKQKESNFVIIYNQGRANQARTRFFATFLVYHVVADELVYEAEYTLNFEDPTLKFDMIYDIFEYNHVLLVSASMQGKDNIQVVSCQFDLAAPHYEIFCSTKFHDTGIPTTRGFVAMVDISGYWAEYQFDTDMKEGTLTLFALEGLFNSEGWKRELRSMENVPALETEHEWIRRIEGSIDNIAIQWAVINNSPQAKNGGLKAYDTGSALVSFELGFSKMYNGYSVAVLGENVFFASLSESDVYIRRFSPPFFWAKGSQINLENTNVITITATDKDNTASVTANIHLLTNPRTAPILDFRPPYLDVIPGSTFELPFTGDSWISGNNLKFSVAYNDSHFSLTTVQQSGRTDVVFRPIPPSNNYNKIMFGDTGAVTHTGDVYTYYSCQYHKHGGATCDQTFQKKTGRLDEDIQSDVFSKHGTIGHWSIGKDGNTYIYVAVFEEGMAVKTIDHAADSVAFTMDVDNNIFVAISNLRSGFVEVWKIDSHFVNQWTFYQNFTASSVGLTELCPGQLRADPQEPTTFHVVSHCQMTGDPHGVMRIVALPLKGYRSSLEGKSIALGSGTIDETGVIPNFCPMKNHHIVYTHGMNSQGEVVSKIYAISKFSYFDRYFISLEKAGFSYVDVFECFSDIEMYAIHGPDDHGVKTFGLFWGDKKYNNAKFANLILPDISTKQWNNLESYYTGDYIIHVGYETQEQQSFAATLIHPPRIMTKVENMPGYYETITPVEWTITASNGFFNSKITGTVYARKTNMTIGYLNRKQWISSTGWLDIEQYTRINGPVTKVSLASSGEDVRIVDRKVSRGSMVAGESPVVFDEYRGDHDNGVGLAIEKGGYGTFYFIKDHEIGGASTKYGADEAYDFESFNLLGGIGKMVFYHGKNGPIHMMSAFVTKGLRSRVDTHFPVPRRATKVRLSGARDNRRFIGFSHDYFGDKTLTVYSITYDSEKEQIYIDLLHEYPEVEDFDICRQDRVTHLHMIKIKSSQLELIDWQFVDGFWKETPSGNIIPDPTRQYWLKNVAAAAGVNKNHVVLNTQGTVIFSGDIKIMGPTYFENRHKLRSLNNKNLGLIQSWRQYDKFQDYEGWQMYINQDYFVIKSTHMDGATDYRALVWKREDADASIHTAIELGVSRTGGEKSLRDHPVTFFNHPIYGSTVAIGTADPNHPLEYIGVDNVKVFIPEDYENINFRDIDIVIEGSYQQIVTVDAMLTGHLPDPNPPDPNPPKPAFAWWPFVIVIGFLIVAAVVWFIYARSKESDDNQYKSVEPETDSGVTEGAFETGLNPKEVAGDEFGSATDDKTDPTQEVRLEKAKAEFADEVKVEDDEEDLKFD